VENLHKDDFQIKQDGKLQFITHFSVETPGSAEKQVARGEAIPLPTDSTSYAISDSAADTSGKLARSARRTSYAFAVCSVCCSTMRILT